MDKQGCKTYAALLTNEAYLPGLVRLSPHAAFSNTTMRPGRPDEPFGTIAQLLLDHTLKQVGTRYPLVVLTTASFPEKHLALLTALGIEYRKVDLLEPKGEVKLIAERFRDTWSKLQAFALEDYEVRRGPLLWGRR